MPHQSNGLHVLITVPAPLCDATGTVTWRLPKRQREGSVPMTTVQVQLDDEVLALLRGEAKARMKPVSEIIRVAAGRWLVNHRVLKQEQLNDAGRLIPDELRRKAKPRRARKEAADEGNVAVLHGDASDGHRNAS
jgi:hypothetical protein